MLQSVACVVDKAIERTDIALVELECRGFPPDGFYLADKTLRLSRVRMVREDDIHTATSQIDRRVAAESAAPTRNNCCSVVSVVHPLFILLASGFTGERFLAFWRRSRLDHPRRWVAFRQGNLMSRVNALDRKSKSSPNSVRYLDNGDIPASTMLAPSLSE
jgi:hypothetical protein